jgi:hypothetical protein
VFQCRCTLSLNEISRETERDWDKDLAEEVKGECEEKYGKVEAIKVDKDSSQVCWVFRRRSIHLPKDGP